MLYVAGSLLIALALISALAALFTTFVQYRAQMFAALRTLSLDSAYERKLAAPAPYPLGPAVSARLDRPVRPAPRLAA